MANVKSKSPAPGPEIEVTPDMIEAGLAAYAHCDTHYMLES